MFTNYCTSILLQSIQTKREVESKLGKQQDHVLTRSLRRAVSDSNTGIGKKRDQPPRVLPRIRDSNARSSSTGSITQEFDLSQPSALLMQKIGKNIQDYEKRVRTQCEEENIVLQKEIQRLENEERVCHQVLSEINERIVYMRTQHDDITPRQASKVLEEVEALTLRPKSVCDAPIKIGSGQCRPQAQKSSDTDADVESTSSSLSPPPNRKHSPDMAQDSILSDDMASWKEEESAAEVVTEHKGSCHVSPVNTD